MVWRENAGLVSGWAALPWNTSTAQSSPGAPGIALSQQSPGGAEVFWALLLCWDQPGIWDGPWDLASPSSNVTASCPQESSASPWGGSGGVPERVPSSLPFPRPASSLPQTGPAGSAVPGPVSRLGSGPGTQPVAESQCCFSSWGGCCQSAVPSGIPAVPGLGLFPCHRWALVSIGWRRSLLGVLQEAKATGSSGLPSSCFKNMPSPAGKWWHLPVGPETKFPSGAIALWNKRHCPL